MQDLDAGAYGIAAYSVLEKLLPLLIESKTVSKSEIVRLLDEVSRLEGSRGVASDSAKDTGAARLTSLLATAIKHLP